MYLALQFLFVMIFFFFFQLKLFIILFTQKKKETKGMSNLAIQSLLSLASNENCGVFGTPSHPDDEGCKLLDSFAILVQITLASTALLTLFYKRSRETPQRPVSVW
jgi:LytS/YehU family sensor histidine kinase